MENTFMQYKHNYQDQSHRNSNPQLQTNKLQKKEKEPINKEATNKNTWHFINIFSKIKKFNKAKANESNSNEEEVKVGNSKKGRKCKFNKMDDKSKPITTKLNDSIEDDTNSVESKRSFFGKMNLESLLKIFVDLHKKKQSSQNRQNTQQIMDEDQLAGENYVSLKPNPSKVEDDNASFIIQKSDLPSSGLILKDPYDSPLLPTEWVHNPVNSPSLINASCDNNNLPNITTTSDALSSTDSTLSLLNNVSVKLRNYLSEVKNNENDKNKENINVLDENAGMKKNHNLMVVQSSALIKQQDNSCSDKLNPYIETDGYLESKENQTILNDEADDKKLAYTIAETDIKRMIKELLQESKDLKNSIVATGIQEEPSSSFTKISRSFDSFLICRSLCNELVNVACNKHICSLKARKHLNVSFKRDTEQEVEYILTSMLENVFSQKPMTQKVCVNFCLVQTNASDKTQKHEPDASTKKFRESYVYILTKRLYKIDARVRKLISPPKVTVHNLSTNKRIKFVTAENSLMSRIRRSAALLMALYDEMRDYSYYSCTSNILCDLYESMIKQGLISMTNLKQELTTDNTSRDNIQSDRTGNNDDHSSIAISPPTSAVPSHNPNPGSSSGIRINQTKK
ncbi:hypothetical protein Trydic_g11000 [Trypoxylus dichotomus]